MDKVIVGKYPIGALFVGSDFETANKVGGWYEKNNYFSGRLFYDGNPGGSINLWLTGTSGDAKRYISPYKTNLPSGWGFKLGRDYLSPIQERQLTLTGGKWVQNPGW
jgi:starch-binding outer membrane protein, SusD/RagB family